MADELAISYSSDIIVKVRHNQDVLVELAHQGPQGPQGEKGDEGDITPELEQAKLDAEAAANAATSARDTAVDAKDTAVTKADEASTSAAQALASENAAKLSETNSKTSETNAKASETNALASKNAASTSETNAKTSETNAKASETAAKISETNSKTSETNALASKNAAAASAEEAAISETNAVASEDAAAASALAAKASETNSKTSEANAKTSETNAAASNTAAGNAKMAAETARTDSQTARDDAQAARSAASGARADAIAARDAAQTAKTGAEAAQTGAETARDEAEDWAAQAAQSAVEAAKFDPSSYPMKINNGSDFADPAAVRANIGAAAELELITQPEAEAGSETIARNWNAQRVRQAIVAFAANKNHTHTADEITGLQAKLDALLASPAFTGTPTVPTAAEGDDSAQIANTAFVTRAIEAIVGMAPEDLDTLKEIADRITAGETETDAILATLNNKSDKGHTHTMSEITGLVAALALLAPLASPALTGTPTAPTAAAATNNTQIATTAHVKLAIANSGLASTGHKHVIADVTDLQDALDAKSPVGHKHVMADITDLAAAMALLAPKASPALTGTPTAPTQAVGNNSTRIATTAFVTTAVQNATSGKADAVHTHAISDVTSLQAALDAKLDLTGGSLGGVLTNSAEFRSTSQNSYRFVSGDYGIFQRFDGSNWYLMLTASGDQNGAYNSLRPLRVSATTGAVAIGNGLSVAGTATFTGNVTGSGFADFARFYGTNSDSAAAPSFTNASDLDTGLWFPGADSIGFTTGGSNRMTLAGNTLSLNGPGTAAIEIGRTDGTASTPVIDFHSGATATDYDARIIASGGNGTSGGGSLNFTSASSTFSGTVSAVSFSGSGASLTSLNASNLASGTIADARIPALAISKITNLQSALDGKLSTSGKAASATTADQLGGVAAANYLRKDSDQQMAGVLLTRPLNCNVNNNDGTNNLQVQNQGGTGDSAVAAMAFLCQNQYGIKMHLRADGYFGLGGWSRGNWSWYTAPNGDMTAAGNVGAYSDPRLKDDVEVIENALDIVESLRGVRFTWNNKTKLLGKPGERDIGVLADEVEAVLPEIVGRSIPDEDNDGEQWRTVAYDKITPVLIQAIKELRTEVADLRARAV